mmetsp:Transcript_25481/g.74277  ORF Transcript_25481/g.74277 Transcript_25481/m.74277 type:complete len:344 (-) Transcript_25481:146-1177(-)
MLQQARVNFAVTDPDTNAESATSLHRRRRGRPQSKSGGTLPPKSSKQPPGESRKGDRQQTQRRRRQRSSKSQDDEHKQLSFFPQEETEGRVYFKPFLQASPIRTKSSSGNLHREREQAVGAGGGALSGGQGDVGVSLPQSASQRDLADRPVPRLPHHNKPSLASSEECIASPTRRQRPKSGSAARVRDPDFVWNNRTACEDLTMRLIDVDTALWTAPVEDDASILAAPVRTNVSTMKGPDGAPPRRIRQPAIPGKVCLNPKNPSPSKRRGEDLGTAKPPSTLRGWNSSTQLDEARTGYDRQHRGSTSSGVSDGAPVPLNSGPHAAPRPAWVFTTTTSHPQIRS